MRVCVSSVTFRQFLPANRSSFSLPFTLRLSNRWRLFLFFPPLIVRRACVRYVHMPIINIEIIRFAAHFYSSIDAYKTHTHMYSEESKRTSFINNEKTIRSNLKLIKEWTKKTKNMCVIGLFSFSQDSVSIPIERMEYKSEKNGKIGQIAVAAHLHSIFQRGIENWAFVRMSNHWSFSPRNEKNKWWEGNGYYTWLFSQILIIMRLRLKSVAHQHTHRDRQTLGGWE